jgi:hypothetical protein
LQRFRRAIRTRLNEKNGKRPRLPFILAFGVLAALVILTFLLYMSKLSQVQTVDARNDMGSEAQVYGQTNEDLEPPGGVTVTVEKGATVRWDGEEDVRIIGYNVYRYKAGEGPGSKINASIISDTVYHDDEGTMFNSYAVAPVDTDGKQGLVSIPVAAVAEPVSLVGLTPTQDPQMLEDITFEGPGQGTKLPPNVVDCTTGGMSYYGVWYLEHYAQVAGGTLMVTPYYGDYMTYTFVGDSIAVISTRHWNYGIMDIFIDGELRQEVDLYSSDVLVQQRVFTATGLGSGAHTIKLVCTGRRNPNANFTFINVEGFEVK